MRNRVDSIQGKYQIAGAKGLNETYLSYQRYRWNPTAENYETVGENFTGLLRIGGRDTNQRMVQARTSLRHDHTRFLRWSGTHTAKVGGVASFADYDIRKELNGNPLFTYVNGISWNFPARAAYGVGDPDLSGSNWQIGAFAQDDWAVTPRLTVNLGIRWDYETGMINTDYVTPETVRNATRIVRRRQPLLHRRRRSLAVLRRRAAARSASPTTCAATADRSPSAASAATTIACSMTGRSPSARACSMRPARSSSRESGGIRDGVRDDRLESVVPEPRGTRLAHRARDRAGARSPPDGQRGEAAGLEPVVARAPPEDGHDRRVGDLQRHAHAEHPDLHSRQPPSRRHLLPRRSRVTRASSSPISKGARRGSTRSTSRPSGRSAPTASAGASASPTRSAMPGKPAAISSASTTGRPRTIRFTRPTTMSVTAS